VKGPGKNIKLLHSPLAMKIQLLADGVEEEFLLDEAIRGKEPLR